MLRLSSIGGKWVALGVSAGVHVAVVAGAALGHGGAWASTSAAPLALEVEVDTSEPDTPVPPDAPATQAARVHASVAPRAATPRGPSTARAATTATAEPTAQASQPDPVPAPAETSPAPLPRFTLNVTTRSQPAPETGGAEAMAGATGAPSSGEPLAESAVSTPARAVHRELPIYPAEARHLGIEADVPLEIVVSAAGSVESVSPRGGAGHGLDAAAASAMRAFRFAPATRQGRPVRVRMRWVMQFRLQ